MNEKLKVEIVIPSDEEGFILLKCGYCGNFFKIPAQDLNNDTILNLYCPCCGLISDNYLSGDVIYLAQAIINNYGNDIIYDAFKDLGRISKKGVFQLKIENIPQHESENFIKTGIEALEIATFDCCNKNAKIKPLLKMTGCYCPFCGVKEYDVK